MFSGHRVLIRLALLMVALWLAGNADVLAEDALAVDKSIKQSTQAPPGERVVYTIEGKKDPRLQATFLATYISTSKSAACSHRNPATATRKVNIGSKRYPITEENYRIEIPVYLEESENECGYRFSRIELLLRRLYDDELYSRHILLDHAQEVMAIYYGRKGGFGGGGVSPLLMPGTLFTDKRYFRIAKQTQYVCRTNYFVRMFRDEFYCFMRIRGGEGENQFVQPSQYSIVTHPEFGVDAIKSDTLQVDLVADDLGSKAYTGKETLQDHFRVLPKPESSQPPPWKKNLKRWLQDLF